MYTTKSALSCFAASKNLNKKWTKYLTLWIPMWRFMWLLFESLYTLFLICYKIKNDISNQYNSRYLSDVYLAYWDNSNCCDNNLLIQKLPCDLLLYYFCTILGGHSGIARKKPNLRAVLIINYSDVLIVIETIFLNSILSMRFIWSCVVAPVRVRVKIKVVTVGFSVFILITFI